MPDLKFDRDLAKFTPRQVEAVKLLDSGLVKYLLYGGALGGGKSYFLRWYGIRRLMRLAEMGYKNCTAMLACEDYPALKDRQLSKIPREFPPELGQIHQDHKEYGRCFILAPNFGSGVLCFRNLDDPSKYQSSEWVLVLIDELTKNDYDTFTQLRMRLRWPGLSDMDCQFVGGTNPGGIGHGWVKSFWIDKVFSPEWINPKDYRDSFAFVPSKADDNPHLDAAYWGMLDTLPENLRAAFRDGSWDIFVGQAFPELSITVHGIEPIWPIPTNSPLYMTYDWGFGKPFSLGWWWTDNDGRALRFNEWYGASGPDQGLRLGDSEVAEGIIDQEVKLGLAHFSTPGDYRSVSWDRQIIRYSGPDCFAKRPDYKGGGQGPSTAEVFAQYGIFLMPGDPDRVLRIRQFRERLRARDGESPMMLIYKSCKDFFRTVSSLVMDKNRPEDIDSDGEDHCFAGDTVIRTDKGLKSISSLVGIQGLIQTVDGSYVPFENCRKTRINSPTVEVIFSDNYKVVCTPDHEFLTISGDWVKAVDLTDELCYVSMQEETLCESSSLAKLHRNSTERGTGAAVYIFRGRGKDFIGQYGNTIMVQFQKASKYITKTMTEAIIKVKTWNYGLTPPTVRITPNLMTIPTGLNLCIEGPQSGMEVQRASSGTKNSIRSIAGKRYLENTRISANIAEILSKQAKSLNTALQNAGWPFMPQQGKDGKKESVPSVSRFLRLYGVHANNFVRNHVQSRAGGQSLRVVKVRPFERTDVYCLNVPSTHCFALENGLIVSNCYDEACFLCMARPLSAWTPVQPKTGPQRIIEAAEQRFVPDALPWELPPEAGEQGFFEGEKW